MVENQHKKISGYRDLTEVEIAAMNRIKDAERLMANALLATKGEVLDALNPVRRIMLPDDPNKPALDESMRQLALARTHFEEAFMHLVRAIARPDSPWLPEPRANGK